VLQTGILLVLEGANKYLSFSESLLSLSFIFGDVETRYKVNEKNQDH
jgi:hypothetical protein